MHPGQPITYTATWFESIFSTEPLANQRILVSERMATSLLEGLSLFLEAEQIEEWGIEIFNEG